MVTSSLQTESIEVGIESDSTAAVNGGILSPVEEKVGVNQAVFRGITGAAELMGTLLGTSECPFTALIVRVCNSVTH